MATNHQYVGLTADTAVSVSPTAHVKSKHPTTPDTVGQPRERQAAQGREAENRQADPELGSRQAGLLGNRRTMGDVAEMLRDIAERRDGPELSETSRHGQQRRAHYGRFAPTVEVELGSGLRAVSHGGGG